MKKLLLISLLFLLTFTALFFLKQNASAYVTCNPTTQYCCASEPYAGCTGCCALTVTNPPATPPPVTPPPTPPPSSTAPPSCSGFWCGGYCQILTGCTQTYCCVNGYYYCSDSACTAPPACGPGTSSCGTSGTLCCSASATCQYSASSGYYCSGGTSSTPIPTTAPPGALCYSCSGGSCVAYCGTSGCNTDSSCGGSCGGGGPTSPPTTPIPTSAGRYECQGNSCISTDGGPYPDSTCNGACASGTHVIYGHVYQDLNGNGTFDPGEGYNGALVKEYNGSTVIDSMDTANYGSLNGWYDGTYDMSLPSTATSVALDSTSVSDYNILSPNPVVITNTNIDNVVDWKIAIAPTPTPTPTPTYSISGNVFVDVNKNQLFDSGESDYSSGTSTINIYPGSQASGTPVQTIVTNNGIFTTGKILVAGTYTVSYSGLPSGWQMTEPVNGPPPSFTINIGPGCSVGSSNSASCDSSNNITALNYGITNSIPWCQFIGGSDVNGGGGFSCPCTGSDCGGPGPSPCIYDFDCSGGLTCNKSGSSCVCNAGSTPGNCDIAPTPTPTPSSIPTPVPSPTPTPPTCTSGQNPCYSCSGITCNVACASSCDTTCNTSCGYQPSPTPVPSPTPTPPTCSGGQNPCYSCSGTTCNVACAASCSSTCDASCGYQPSPTPSGGPGGSGAPCVYDTDCNNNLACDTSGSNCTCQSGTRPGNCTLGNGGPTGGGPTGGGITTGPGTGGTPPPGSFNNPIPPTASGVCGGPYASIPGSTSTTPGLIFTGNGSAYFGQGSASLNNWLVGGTNYPETFGPINQGGLVETSYSYLLSIAKQAGITPVDLSSDASFCSFGGLTNCKLSSTLPHGIYIANDNLTLTGGGTPPSYTFPFVQSYGYIILVHGNLTIQTRLLVPNGSTALFSASGNIIVDSSVGETGINSYETNCIPSTVAGGISTGCDIEGVFSADQSFIIQGQNDCTIGADSKLNVAGNIITNAALNGGTFVNARDLCENDAYCPVFTIQTRPDFILNAPNFIKKTNSTWQELAP